MQIFSHLAYLVAAVLFILGLKLLGSPQTARRGNALAMLGMLVAVLVTLVKTQILDWSLIIAGLVIGSFIGAVAARRVRMTAMPQMVALFNGFGGGASALVAYAELASHHEFPTDVAISVFFSLLIGSVTFFGSLVAYAKLQGLMRSAPVFYRGQQVVNGLLLAACVALGVMLVLQPTQWMFSVAVILLASLLGVLLVIPIGGADMPVVISLLNSYSGLAAAATGFVLSNNVLIVSGALVGASGLILTSIMCVAMNRSLGNVLFAGVGTDDSAGTAGGNNEHRAVTRYTPMDMAVMLERANSVIIVTGYGLAVAQAQHVLHEMAQMLISEGIKVRYAIHPVAGRMPGHMNVLLAEANVPYDLLYEMDNINDDFKDTDVALVIGANDVINPAARYKKDSPLYGMPILNVDQAQTVIICKRSLSPGFSGEDNELFYDDKTMMVFGDAKKTLTELVKVMKD